METWNSDSQSDAAFSRRLLVIACALGLLSAGLLFLYLNRFEREMSGGHRVKVLSLARPLERGELIAPDSLAVSEVPVAYLEQRAVRASDRSKILGVPAAHHLDPQDTIMWTDLMIAAEARDLSSLVQPGKRAVTVRAHETGSDPAGSGLVRPGDYVDVFVALGAGRGTSEELSVILLLQRVLVLAVGSETDPHAVADGERGGRLRDGQRQLTLSLRPEEVQLLSLARARGTLSVALRDPGDTKIVEGLADMPLSVLYDKPSRESVQRGPRGPVRLTGSLP